MRTFGIALVLIAMAILALPAAATATGEAGNEPRERDIIVHVSSVTDQRVGYLDLVMDVTYISERWDIVAGTASEADAEAIAAFPFVTGIEPSLDYRLLLDVSARAVRARNDTMAGQTAYSPLTAWDLGYKGEGIIVAILDSGVDDEYQGRLDDLDDLQGTTDPKFIGGYNAQTDIEENPDDENGHGTLVAGIVMGTAADDDTWLGVAPAARLVDVRVAGANGQTNSVQLLRGIEWCIANLETDWD
ncbi:MAG: S8 family serine peptidase, partial [Thermoplasmata archaeon]|nr:S8 family serine peptidase [Thermoplasmata archaeon]